MTLSLLDREIAATADLLHGDDPYSLHDHLLRLLEIKQEEIERLGKRLATAEEMLSPGKSVVRWRE